MNWKKRRDWEKAGGETMSEWKATFNILLDGENDNYLAQATINGKSITSRTLLLPPYLSLIFPLFLSLRGSL